MATLNPTRNWCYREIVKPLHDFTERGIVSEKLLCEVDDEGKPIMVDGKPVPLIELFEGSTYENVDNVGEDYIRGMLATYTGSMRERFVFGRWGALVGLIYPQFDETVHVLAHEDVSEHICVRCGMSGFQPSFVEGYDHGLADIVATDCSSSTMMPMCSCSMGFALQNLPSQVRQSISQRYVQNIGSMMTNSAPSMRTQMCSGVRQVMHAL